MEAHFPPVDSFVEESRQHGAGPTQLATTICMSAVQQSKTYKLIFFRGFYIDNSRFEEICTELGTEVYGRLSVQGNTTPAEFYRSMIGSAWTVAMKANDLGVHVCKPEFINELQEARSSDMIVAEDPTHPNELSFWFDPDLNFTEDRRLALSRTYKVLLAEVSASRGGKYLDENSMHLAAYRMKSHGAKVAKVSSNAMLVLSPLKLQERFDQEAAASLVTVKLEPTAWSTE